MSRYTIANEKIAPDQLRCLYATAKQNNALHNESDLDLIFEVALHNPDRFPGINTSGSEDPQTYLDRWVKGYCAAINNPPSKRTANPKSACTDPAIATIVKATQGFNSSQSAFGESTHNLFMSAENIQGNLLEEYIASKTRPYGFLWCDGNVLHATDFCNTDGSLFLQIKNKSNTENSSSSTVREGTTIKKWYRLGTRTKNGVPIPDYKWPLLNEYVNHYATEGKDLPPCNMNEDDYEAFLTEVAVRNQLLITNR